MFQNGWRGSSIRHGRHWGQERCRQRRVRGPLHDGGQAHRGEGGEAGGGQGQVGAPISTRQLVMWPRTHLWLVRFEHLMGRYRNLRVRRNNLRNKYTTLLDKWVAAFVAKFKTLTLLVSRYNELAEELKDRSDSDSSSDEEDDDNCCIMWTCKLPRITNLMSITRIVSKYTQIWYAICCTT